MAVFDRVPAVDFLTLTQWADEVVLALDPVGPIARLDSGDPWQDWAAGLCGINGLSQLNIPSPYGFSDWRDWAERFVELVG